MNTTTFSQLLVSRVSRALLPLLLLAGCGGGHSVSQVTAVPKRAGTILVDGCGLDDYQQSTLAAAPAKQVTSQVIFLCLSLEDDGSVGLRNGTTQADISSVVSSLHGQGYKVSLAVTAVDGQDQTIAPTHLQQLLQDATWRDKTVQALGTLATLGDGLEVALPTTVDASRGDVSTLVAALKTQLGGQRALGVFVPPSVMDPSDIAGGNAFDVTFLGAHADRIRVMTLDFSCCTAGIPAGPTMDAQWAVTAGQLALSKAPGTQLDIAMPLYGTDFTVDSAQNEIDHTFVDYDQAVAGEAQHQVAAQRGPGDAPHFSYTDTSGTPHQVWYDDSRSTLRTLSEWTGQSLPLAVGVVYYALGSEDPTLWASIASAQH